MNKRKNRKFWPWYLTSFLCDFIVVQSCIEVKLIIFSAIFILGKILIIRCTFEIVIAALLIHGARKVYNKT